MAIAAEVIGLVYAHHVIENLERKTKGFISLVQGYLILVYKKTQIIRGPTQLNSLT